MLHIVYPIFTVADEKMALDMKSTLFFCLLEISTPWDRVIN